MDLRDLVKLAGIVNPEVLNRIDATAEVEEADGAGFEQATTAPEEEIMDDPLQAMGSDVDTSLRRYLKAKGDHATIDEEVYPDHTVESVSEAYATFKTESAEDRARYDADETPRGEKKKKVSLKKAPWEKDDDKEEANEDRATGIRGALSKIPGIGHHMHGHDHMPSVDPVSSPVAAPSPRMAPPLRPSPPGPDPDIAPDPATEPDPTMPQPIYRKPKIDFPEPRPSRDRAIDGPADRPSRPSPKAPRPVPYNNDIIRMAKKLAGESVTEDAGKVGYMEMFFTDRDGGEVSHEVEVTLKDGKLAITGNMPGPEDDLYYDDADIEEQLRDAQRDMSVIDFSMYEADVEENAFNQAAAAAARANKSEFEFGGKTHKTTMKKDTAHKLDDSEDAELSVLRRNAGL